MAPHSSQSSAPSPSLKRKQATISSFFTQKPASTAPKDSEVAPTKTPKKRQASPIEKISESQEQTAPAEDDEDDDDDGIVAPAPKRAKATRTDEEPIRVATRMPFEHPSQPSSQRTDIFKFQSSPSVATAPTEDKDPEQESRRKEKERLHKKFVQKLGGTDCQIGIGRTAVNDVASAEAEADAAEAEEDDEPPPPPTKGKGAKKAGSKLTPMEKQVIEIKRQHMNTVLVIEVGYKFRFFGEDARIAAKELGIVCIPGKFRFDERKCICIPVYRRILTLEIFCRSLRSTHWSVCFS